MSVRFCWQTCKNVMKWNEHSICIQNDHILSHYLDDKYLYVLTKDHQNMVILNVDLVFKTPINVNGNSQDTISMDIKDIIELDQIKTTNENFNDIHTLFASLNENNSNDNMEHSQPKKKQKIMNNNQRKNIMNTSLTLTYQNNQKTCKSCDIIIGNDCIQMSNNIIEMISINLCNINKKIQHNYHKINYAEWNKNQVNIVLCFMNKLGNKQLIIGADCVCVNIHNNGSPIKNKIKVGQKRKKRSQEPKSQIKSSIHNMWSKNILQKAKPMKCTAQLLVSTSNDEKDNQFEVMPGVCVILGFIHSTFQSI